ncbi:chromate efflux transporter [Roseivirga pacifica]|uniref:chromate efflux transporter n=1 Tax=Roseivirga pacifica TaxID=1267423 RepID=UPI0020966048|nr:chromate efflux transporter [Roseivirga pacifica]MCO6359445.1 chromate efflux transporter [Roseivirga pacifica]MCO6366815.1 chromate efflux transporter [Roseivirga pacifica]MCO6370653.1 chromate efflux transporter [Roseivirga pacifica]MCO6374471.1 chromate efflux transporter [Roseivirga pacifica]MCO6379730.1 chromate efflux transporter [Roseivirga pacifica]
MAVKRIRYYIFLKDVLIIAISAFGGPQAHMAMFINILVKKRAYITEEELMELYALCQILPGPTSTQTITAIGFRIGRAGLAYLTLLVWMLPAVAIMTTAAILINSHQAKNFDLEFTRFIQPMAVGFISYGAYVVASRVVNTRTAGGLMALSAIVTYFINKPAALPIVLVFAGALTAFKYKKHEKEEIEKVKIKWGNFTLWGLVLVAAALLGGFTQDRFVLLFENFYRNGSLIFGGGQVLIPFLNTEFVEAKGYLSSEEFLSGLAMVQAVPGPVFSVSSFVGALSVRDLGLGGQILAGFISACGIFLPGTFLIFFVIRFWDSLKKYRVVRASLEGIHAASAGMVAAAAFVLFEPIDNSVLNVSVVIGTFLLLTYTKVPPPFIILAGLIAGFML